MKVKNTLIALISIAIASGAVAGGMNKGQGRNMNNMQQPAFSQFDLNGDEMVTEEEFNAYRAERQAARAEDGRRMTNAGNASSFGTFDKNDDGVISEEEFMAIQGNNRGGRGKNK